MAWTEGLVDLSSLWRTKTVFLQGVEREREGPGHAEAIRATLQSVQAYSQAVQVLSHTFAIDLRFEEPERAGMPGLVKDARAAVDLGRRLEEQVLKRRPVKGGKGSVSAPVPAVPG